MLDLERRFESLDRLDAPDLWTNIEQGADDRLRGLSGTPSLDREGVTPRGVLVAAGVAVVILVVIGLATWLMVGAEQDTPPVITQDVTPTSLQATTPETTVPQTTLPDTAVPKADDMWAPVPDPDGVFAEATVQDVSVGDLGFVAVGVGAVDTQGAIWVSSDGISWARVPDPEGLFSAASVEGITEGGPGLVAVGADWTTRDIPRAAIWTSPDGWGWARVPHDPAVFGSGFSAPSGGNPRDGGLIEAVVNRGSDLVAVGSFCAPLETGCAWVTSAWLSTQGSSWTRLASPESGLGEGGGLSDLAVGPSGLVAVGVAWPGSNGAVWTSVDGTSWTRVPHNEAVFGGEDVVGIVSVTAGRDGLVAVGSSLSMEPPETCPSSGSLTDGACGEHIVVWTSPDGLGWERVPHSAELFGSDVASTRAGGIAARGDGYVLVGVKTLGDAKYGTIWTSPDGTDWTESAETQPLGDELHAAHFDGTKHLVFGKIGDDTVLYTTATDTSR